MPKTGPKIRAPKQAQPLMPHATATWLVENTSLSFRQVAAFCQIHLLEVQAIADETSAAKLTPRDPVRAGELTMEEIEKGQEDHSHRLRILAGPTQKRRTSGPRYTPLSKRQDKPDGIAWILRNHPEITDAQISRLIGTTKTTISAIRNREHWNIANITPKDPVTLGLCGQHELDALTAATRESAEAETAENRLGADREAILAELKAERESVANAPAEEVELSAETLFKTPDES